VAVTRIKNNQITDASAGNTQLGINANTKLQNYSVTSIKLANNITYGSDLTITGNLSVTGTTTAVDTTYVNIQDPLIVLADGQTANTPTVDIGYIGLRGNAASGNIASFWNEANSTFTVAFTSSGVLDNTTVAIVNYADFKANNINAVTNISAAGNVNANNVNVANNVSVGGNITVDDVLAINVSASGNINANSVAVINGVSVGGNVQANAVLVLNSGAISTAGNVSGANVNATTVSASGNVDGANVNATTVSVSANVTANNVTVGNIVSATGNIVTSNFFVGDGYFISNINPGNIGTPTKIQNGGTFANATAANANLTIAVGATSNLVATFYDTGVDINGTASVGGNVNAANVNVSANVSATGNVYAANFATTGAGGNITGANVISSTTVTTTGSIFAGANLSAGGNVFATNNLSVGGSVEANSVGVLNNGSITTGGNVVGGNVLSNGVLSVTGTANVGNLVTNGLVSATGNAQIGNIATGGQVSASGNVTANVLVGSFAEVTNTANVGNVTTIGFVSATGNIEAGNILTAGRLSATGDVFGNNVSAVANVNGANVNATNVYVTKVSASGNVIAGNVVSNFLYSDGSALTISATGTNSGISILTNGTGNIGVGSTYINNLLNPEQPQDAATKQYVDDVAQGLNIHDSTSAATGNTLANITGGAITYYNGPANNGVGATLTTTGTYTTIDGVNVTTANTRILVRAEANAVFNGIYVYSNATVITRAADYNQVPEVEAGDFVFNLYGNVYGNTSWVQTSNVSNVGQAGNNIVFTQFAGAGTYIQGNGIAIVANEISTRINTGNLEYDGSGNLQVSTSAAFTTPNIGSATGSILSLTGNVTASAVGATELSASGNVYGGNVSAAGTIVAVSNIAGGNLLTGNVISAGGTVTGGNLVTGGFLSVAANVFAGNLSLAGNVFSDINMLTNITTGGYITAVGNVSGGNINAVANISATGNVVGGNIIFGSGVVSGTGNVTGGNVLFGSGVVSGSGTISGGNVDVVTDVSAGGNVKANAVLVLNNGAISTGGNVDGNNVNVTTGVSVGGNVTANNVTVGNIVSAGGNIVTGSFFVGDGHYISNINPGNVAVTKLVNGGTYANIASADGNLVIAIGAASNVTTTFANNLLAANGVISASGNIVSGNLTITPTQSIVGAVANGNIVLQANGTGEIIIQNTSSSALTVQSTGSNVTNIINVRTTGTALGINGGGAFAGSYILGNGSPTQTQNRLAVFTGHGSEDGTTIGNSKARIALDAAADWSNVSTPTHVSFWVTNTGSTNPAETVRFQGTGNVVLYSGNLNVANGNIDTANVNVTGNVSVTGNIASGNLSTGGQIYAAGNVTVNSFFYVDPVNSTVLIASNSIVACSVLTMNATSSFVVPTGNTAQRPSSVYTGMIRFNTTQNNLEIYDNNAWTPVGSTQFTVISDEQFEGDGATVNFTLSSTQTTNSCIVSINGVVQIPTLAYSVAGTNPTCVLTFTEAPASGDVIDVRQITTTVTVMQIDNVSGNAIVAASPTSSQINITGNLVTTVNSTAPTLVTNSTMSFQLASNTQLNILVRGSDGTTRSVALTLS
jgi:hypothetical protein